METMHLAPSTASPATPRSDDDLIAMFEAVGLEVALVDHCNDASCPVCFAVTPAQAAA